MSFGKSMIDSMREFLGGKPVRERRYERLPDGSLQITETQPGQEPKVTILTEEQSRGYPPAAGDDPLKA